MELRIDDSKKSLKNLPEDTIISIRAGKIRRQVPISLLCDGSQKLKFPKPVDTTESLKIDVLKPIYRGSLILVPGVQAYQLNFDMGSSTKVEYSGEIDCDMSVSFDDGLEHNGNDPTVAQADKKKYDDSANQARDYLDQKSVLKYIQTLLKDTLEKKPEDPLEFMWEEIGKSISKPRSDKKESSEEFRKACDELTSANKKLEDTQTKVQSLTQKADDVSKQSREKLANAEERERQDAQKLADMTEKLKRYENGEEKPENGSSGPHEIPADLQKTFEASKATLDKAEKEREAMAKEVKEMKLQLSTYSEDRKRYEESLEKLAVAEKQREALEKTVSELEAHFKTHTVQDGGELSEKASRLEHDVDSLQMAAKDLQDQMERVLLLRRKEEEARSRVEDKGVNPIEDINCEAMNRTLHEFEESRKLVVELEKEVEEQNERIKTLQAQLVEKVDKSQIMVQEAQKQFPEIATNITMDPDKNHQPIEIPKKSPRDKKPEELDKRHENAKQLLRAKFQEKNAALDTLIEQALHGYKIEKNTKQALAAAFQHIMKTDGNLDNLVQKAQTAVKS